MSNYSKTVKAWCFLLRFITYSNALRLLTDFQTVSKIVLNEGQAVSYFAATELADLRLAYSFDKLLIDFLESH
jgi:hypothetical protein